ncbi:hypothetical protein [Lysinibacillus composti]|uniref:hypothetical protein n=1 Tax=Lysinibacillus composti TaxID=720633 RepID=UPI001961BEC9|nr:hypothetical protein [Lysinibacillus composti]
MNLTLYDNIRQKMIIEMELAGLANSYDSAAPFAPNTLYLVYISSHDVLFTLQNKWENFK